MVELKKKVKFRLRIKKDRKKLKEFNIDELDFIWKIKGFKYKYDLESKKKNFKKKNKKEEDNENLVYSELLGDKSGYIEKEIVERRLKQWKFLNFSEFKLWSILYELWRDIEFDFRFTSYQFLFTKPGKGYILTSPDQEFDTETENALLFDFENLSVFSESSDEAEEDPDYDEYVDYICLKILFK